MMVFLRVMQIKMARAICFTADPVGPLAALCGLVTAQSECVREGANLSSTGPSTNEFREELPWPAA
jgi:hypothetical protein